MPQEDIEERLEILEKERGWVWQKWSYPEVDCSILMPPKGDVRHNWCAMWLQVSVRRTIPHWALRDDALKKLNDRGIPIENGS